MESLARRFWRPVFAYVSATRPNQPLDSAAIAERFLVSLCQKNLDEVAPEIRSRLRTLIRTSLQLAGTSKFERYALPENADSTSIIGLTDTASLDLLPGTYPPDSSPEELFEYEWARSIAEASLRMLKKKLTAIGREGSWTMLQRHDFAWGDHRVKPLRELAQELRGSELGLRISLAYGRTLWRRLMLDQMSHTVQDVGDVVTELKEVHDLLPTWGAFWPLLRMVLNSDDDFILLQLYVEKARLRSDQIKGFADILELPGDRIGELMVQRNLVTTDQLWALLKQKEDHLTELMEGAATTIVAEQAPSMPAEVREALKKSENLIGKFVKVSFLGKGSTGNVWKCWDTKTGEYVAIKVFENLPMTRRVLREAQLSSKLDHPNIVRVRDLGRDGDSYYAVLDYVHGKTLGGERMPVKKALEVAFEVASAVDYAHQQGIIHRDLKPQNIMVNAFGKVVVLDFGIARQSSVESLGQGGVVLGTPQYMAPEQAAAGTDDVDIACDVYGVGATLYHLVSGRPPYEGANPIEIITRLLREPPPSVREFLPDIPEAVEAIIDRAMAREKSKRYPSCRALAREIETVIHMLKEPTRVLEAVKSPAGAAAGFAPAALRRPSVVAPVLFWLVVILGGLSGIVLWVLSELRSP